MIDPSIALGYRPPQINIDVPSPIHQMGQVLTLRGLMEQSQARQLEMQQTRMQIDAAQRAQQDDQILRKSYADAGGDLDKTAAFLMQRGGSPTALANLQKQRDAHLESLAKMNKDQLDTVKFNNDQMMGLIGQAQAMNPDQYTQAWPVLRQRAMALDKTIQLPDTPIPQDQLQNLSFGHVTFGQLIDQAKAKREAAQSVATIAKDQSEALKNQQAAQQTRQMLNARLLLPAIQKGPDSDEFKAALAGLPPEDQAVFQGVKNERDLWQRLLTPEQRQQAETSAATLAETEKQHGIENTLARARLGVSQQEQALRQKQYDATYGQLVDPNTGKPLEGEAAKALAMQDPLAVSIANYQNAPPAASRGGQGATIMRRVMAINPDYNANNWAQQKATLLDYSPAGKTGVSLSKMGTALGHLGVLDDAAEALKNTNLPMLNKIANSLGLAVGKDAVTTFNTIVHRLGPEIEGAYVAGGGTAGERGTTEKDFDPNLGYQQIKSNIATSAKLFRSKVAQTEYQWNQVMGKKPMPFLLSPEAQGTMTRVTGADIEGKGGSAPQSAAPGTWSRTGTDAKTGHKLGWNPGDQFWTDTVTGKPVK